MHLGKAHTIRYYEQIGLLPAPPRMEVAAPKPNRVFAHPKCLANPRTGPARQSQQHGAGTVRLATIARAGQRRQRRALALACQKRRSSGHALLPRIDAGSESDHQTLVNQAESA